MEQQDAVFTARAQIDAIALCPQSQDKDQSPLLAVAISSLEGNQWNGGLALVDAVTGQRRLGLELPTGVSSLAWCGPEQDLLACACDNGDIELLQLTTSADGEDPSLQPVQQANPDGVAVGLWGHDDVVTSVSASSFEKNIVASSSWDLSVKLWDLSAMDTTVATLTGHTDLIWSVVMSPTQAHVLATASQDATVEVWDDRKTNTVMLTMNTSSPALSMTWHPTRETICSVGLDDGSVVTFDTRSPAKPLVELATHQGAVHVLRYSPYHDDLLASGGDDASIYLTNGVLPNLKATKLDACSHTDYVRALVWFQAPSSEKQSFTTFMTSGSWDKTLRLWNMDSLSTA